MNVITLQGVGKTYVQYEHVLDRLREVLSGKRRHREHTALQPLDLTVQSGEVVGIIGLNGAGKSTLLKLLAGTLQPTCGQVQLKGRVSALLELGTGFHPEMSGRENVYMSGTVMGLTRRQIDELYDSIVDFAGIADFMEAAVKTYSSGMFVRLAFAVATCVPPDILIVDEALSVGDGIFARRSFDRIMQFKQAGRTILFCSHSLYQVEALCDRVIWVHGGRLLGDGSAADVVAMYNSFLGTPGGERFFMPSALASQPVRGDDHASPEEARLPSPPAADTRTRICSVEVMADGVPGRQLRLVSLRTTLGVRVVFVSDIESPVPTLAVTVEGQDGRKIVSAGTANEGLLLSRDENGRSEVTLTFPKFALLKGHYSVNVYLLCEQAIHVYEEISLVAELVVNQEGLEQGVVSLPHHWEGVVAS